MNLFQMLGNDTVTSTTEVSTEPAVTPHTEDSLYNEYVVIGVVLFFSVVVLIILVFAFVRRLREWCCINPKAGFLQAYSSISYDDNSFEDIDDDTDSCLLYATCELHVDDPVVIGNTVNGDKSDYDCVSVDDVIICNSERMNSERVETRPKVHFAERSWIN